MVRTDQPLVERMTLVWHDWFATSNDGVGQQNLMLDQNELFRRHALGSFDAARARRDDGPGDARLAQPRPRTAREPERELRARADGAVHAGRRPRRLHGDRRARAGARADRLARRLERRARAPQLPLTPRPATTHGNKTVFGQTGNLELGARPSACASATRCTRRSSSTKLWSYFIPTPPSAGERAALETLYVQSGYQVRPVLEAILLHPQLHAGAAHGQAAGGVARRPAARRCGARSTPRRGPGLRERRPAALLPARRVRLGRHALARHEHVRGRWDLYRDVLNGRQLDGGAIDGYDIAETPEQGVLIARAPGPTLPDAGDGRRADGLRRRRRRRALGTWQQRQYRGLRQNALRHLILSSPDYQTS